MFRRVRDIRAGDGKDGCLLTLQPYKIKRSSEKFERDPLNLFSDDLFVCGMLIF